MIMVHVDYFKQSGKFYMEETFPIQKRFEDFVQKIEKRKEEVDLQFAKDEISKSEYTELLRSIYQSTISTCFDFRNWLSDEIQHDQFIAVVVAPEGTIFYEYLLQYPMMSMPKSKR